MSRPGAAKLGIRLRVPRYYWSELIAFVLTVTAFTGLAQAGLVGSRVQARGVAVAVVSTIMLAASLWGARVGVFAAVHLGFRAGKQRLVTVVLCMAGLDFLAAVAFAIFGQDGEFPGHDGALAIAYIVPVALASLVHIDDLDRWVERGAGRWLEDIQAADRLGLLPWAECYFEIPGMDALDFFLAIPVVAMVTWYVNELVAETSRWAPVQGTPSTFAAFLAVSTAMVVSAVLCAAGARAGNWATGGWSALGRAKALAKLFVMLAANFLGSPIFLLIQLSSARAVAALGTTAFALAGLCLLFLKERLKWKDESAGDDSA